MTRTARCPACGGAAWVPALRLPASAILRCAGCGLGRTEPPPAEADGREQFADDPEYFRRALAEPKDRWWRRFNEAPLDALAAAGARPGLSLLDVGANVGYLVTAADARGYRARGLDGSLAAVAVGRAVLGAQLTCARIEDAAVPPASEDVVTLNHVLEHLPDPARTLRAACAWLRPGGFLVVGLPNFASPIARAAGARWDGLVPSQHIWHFTPLALTQLVTGTGFTGVRWRTRMLSFVPRGGAGWAKWLVRRVLETIGRADNLLLVARRPA
jgi:SAM-dependent methyltransferase